jgi:hypothetical protein
MPTRNDSGTRTFTTATAIAAGLLVKLDSDEDVSIAAVSEQAIGVMRDESFAAGDAHAVDLLTKPGTVICIAAGAFSAGAIVYGRNGGKVDDTSADSAIAFGKAVTAATADGDEVEVMPF